MTEHVKNIARMVIHGAESISLTEKRDYTRHIPMTPSVEAQRRWRMLGTRMRNSMNNDQGLYQPPF